MGLFNPDYLFAKTTNITPDFLAKLGIKNLILDVDNTLATHGNPQPAPGVEEWIKLMKDSGIKLVIASNNYAKRVAPFADRLGLDYVSFSVKPSPLGFLKALKKEAVEKSTMIKKTVQQNKSKKKFNDDFGI